MKTLGLFGGGASSSAAGQILYSGAGIAIPQYFVSGSGGAPKIFPALTFTVDASTNIVTIAGGAGRLLAAQTITATSSGTLPAPMQAGTTYYVSLLTPTTCKLLVSAGGAELDFTNTGTGTHTAVLRVTVDYAGVYTSIRLSDVGWSRWALMNPSNGVYDFTSYADEAIPYWYALGIPSMYTIVSTPTWATADTGVDAYGTTGGAGVPTSTASIATFLTQLLARYNAVSAVNPTGAKMIYAVEHRNEPSFTAVNSASRTWNGTFAQLAAEAKSVYQAVKAADSSCLVVGPGFTGGNFIDSVTPTNQVYGFMNASDGAGGFGRQWTEGVGLHLYGAENRQEVLKTNLDSFKQTLTQSGVASTFPLWDTESGYEVWVAATPSAQLAVLVERIHAIKAALGFQHTNHFQMDAYQPDTAYALVSTTLDSVVRAGFARCVSRLAGKSMTYCAINQNGTVTYTTNGTTYTV